MSRNLFRVDDDSKYTFHIDDIVRSLFFRSEKNIEAAEKLYKDGRVEIIKVSVENIGINIIGFKVKIRDFDESEHDVHIRANETNLNYMSCEPKHDNHRYNDSYDLYRSPCKYEIAALLALKNYIETYNPGDTTDRNAYYLMNTFKPKRKISEKKTEDVIIRMSLSLGCYRDDIAVSLQIGTSKKMYVLKDFDTLVRKYNNNDVMTLGKLVELDFAVQDFTPESKQIYDTIEKTYNHEKALQKAAARNSYYYSYNPSKISVNINESNIDLYYDCLNDNVKINDLPVVRTKKETPLNMNISTSFRGRNKEFNGIDAVITIPELYKGNNYYYTFTEGKKNYVCNRIPSEQSEFIRNMNNVETDDFKNRSIEKRMHIGAKRTSEFINITLPNISKYIKTSEVETDNIKQYLPPTAEIHFYLDAADGIPACYPRSVYNGAEYDFTDHLYKHGLTESERDFDREHYALECAMKYFNIADSSNKRIICDTGDSDRIYDFLTNGINELMQIGMVHSTDSFDAIRIKKSYKFTLGVSIENDLLNLDVTSTDFTQDELLDIIKSYRKKKKYHLLKNGSFIPLDERINELSLMLDAMNVNIRDFAKGKMKIPAYRALYLDKMLDECQEIYADRDKRYKELIRNFKTVNDSDFEVPNGLSDTMREYQKYGFRWLKTLETYNFGGILADDMGLGKTLQIISVLSSAKKESNENNPPSLIVCPASLIYNWYEEFKKFAPDMKVLTISGAAGERKKLIQEADKYDAVVTSYDLLKRDISEYEDKHFLYQIIDEAQYIKNYNTAAAKSVKLIHSKYRFALTGTPIENRLSELWSIFDYLMPNFLYGYETFRKEIETPIVKKNDEDASRRLRRIVSPFILRRLKTDVLKDLPDKIEKTHYSKFEPEQQKIYDGQVLKIKQMLDKENDEEFQKNKLQVLAELTKIRQICCDPSLIFENYEGVSAKREACLDLVKNAIEGNHRILIFSQFTSMLDIIADDLKREGIKYFTIEGSTPKDKRVELVNQFNEGNAPVFLISLKAGGTGLNLTGADMVIHFDPWWNVAAQNQATDRAHRIGQTKKVTVYKLIIKNTIEEKIQNMQEKKKNLAESILNSENVSISSFSKKELLELFEI